jgi:thymidylate synthase (FAD)
VIRPWFWRDVIRPYNGGWVTEGKGSTWFNAVKATELAYFELLALGAAPQEARSILPNSLKTEVVMTANIREWRLIFKLRTSKAAHPQMRELMVPLFTQMKQTLPVFFEDMNLAETE